VASLLNDPAIASELQAYVCSNKWAINLAKLAQFTWKVLILSATDKYPKHIVNEEIPKGLKQYLEYELFPCIQLKVACGISLSTVCHWSHLKAFSTFLAKKACIYDHPDVVALRTSAGSFLASNAGLLCMSCPIRGGIP
jgi:hypothetical protein